MTMHFFEVEEAMKYGVESAILLTNIRFWLTKNKANQSHIHDGYYWTYNSAAAFVELFPYMPRRSISMYLKKLCDLGVLKSGNYNEIKYDRTTWYTIPAEFALKPPEALNLAIGENCQSIGEFCQSIGQIRQSNGENRPSIGQIRQPIPDINTDINTDVIADTGKTESTRDDQRAATVARESQSTATVKSSLSNEELACFEWAKRETYWSKLVYSEKAFLKHYRSESQALKGQFKNWQELTKTEEAKKVKPKVLEVWERQGFKTRKEYDDFMFKQQMDKYAKTGSLA